MTTSSVQVHVRGVVQGVGFRPFVYGLATELGLRGWVRNTSGDVEMQNRRRHGRMGRLAGGEGASKSGR